MKPQRLLVVKLSSIGDVLTATPAMRCLRQSFPDAHIAALVAPGSATVLAGSDIVDEVITFDKFLFDSMGRGFTPAALMRALRLLGTLRRRSFDAVVIMHHLTTVPGTLKYALLALSTGAGVRAGMDNGRGWFLTHRVTDGGFGARHEVEHCLETAATIGARCDGLPMEMPISPSDDALAQELFPGDGLRIAIHAGSGQFSLARRWPLERFAEVGRELERRFGAQIVVVGGEEALAGTLADRLGPTALNLAGRTSIGQLGAVLRRCRLFVGNDSGVMHVAAAVGTPVVAVFGPSNHRAWGPWHGEGRKHLGAVVRQEMDCSPCLYVGPELGRREGCPSRPCLQDLSSHFVLSASERMLETYG